jgi:aminomethyltransferase
MSQKTPLYNAHLKAGAKIVDFHGWELPLHYGSQLEEHHAVRNHAGMFDVSHMTIVDVFGPGAREFLRHILPSDVDKLSHYGEAFYTCLLNHQAGIIDDLIVYHLDGNNYRLVVNSATREKDLKWFLEQANEFAVEVKEQPYLAMIAIQGPDAIALTKKAMTDERKKIIEGLQRFYGVEADGWFIARTGYTGEDGLEIALPAEEAETLWNLLLAEGVRPCGLGARDTLRLEAGMNLSGNDIDESVNPMESRLSWTIHLEPVGRKFIGREALEMLKKKGVTRKQVGLVLLDRGVLRDGQKVMIENGEEGIITSGGFSPTLQKGIALARVPVEAKESCQVDMRGKLVAAKIIKLPFVKKGEKT